MKKSILISLLLPFFLFSCSKNEEVKLENPINSNTGVEVKADSGTIETNIQSGSVEINTGITEEIANSGSLENESGTTKNLVPFSDSQIQDILAKIDENTKKQQEKNTNTGILINGNYKAEYDKINTKIKIIIDGKRNEFNGINGEFLSFIDFSPSGNYLYYISNNGGENGPAIFYNIIDTKTGKNVLLLGGYEEGIGLLIWTKDKKQFIFSKQTLSKNSIDITIKGNFPKTIEIDTGDYLASVGYTDDNYLFTQGKIYNTELKKKITYLKIYDLNTLKEVFSKEIIPIK